MSGKLDSKEVGEGRRRERDEGGGFEAGLSTLIFTFNFFFKIFILN